MELVPPDKTAAASLQETMDASKEAREEQKVMSRASQNPGWQRSYPEAPKGGKGKDGKGKKGKNKDGKTRDGDKGGGGEAPKKWTQTGKKRRRLPSRELKMREEKRKEEKRRSKKRDKGLPSWEEEGVAMTSCRVNPLLYRGARGSSLKRSWGVDQARAFGVKRESDDGRRKEKFLRSYNTHSCRGRAPNGEREQLRAKWPGRKKMTVRKATKKKEVWGQTMSGRP